VCQAMSKRKIVTVLFPVLIPDKLPLTVHACFGYNCKASCRFVKLGILRIIKGIGSLFGLQAMF